MVRRVAEAIAVVALLRFGDVALGGVAALHGLEAFVLFVLVLFVAVVVVIVFCVGVWVLPLLLHFLTLPGPTFDLHRAHVSVVFTVAEMARQNSVDFVFSMTLGPLVFLIGIRSEQVGSSRIHFFISLFREGHQALLFTWVTNLRSFLLYFDRRASLPGPCSLHVVLTFYLHIGVLDLSAFIVIDTSNLRISAQIF